MSRRIPSTAPFGGVMAAAALLFCSICSNIASATGENETNGRVDAGVQGAAAAEGEWTYANFQGIVSGNGTFGGCGCDTVSGSFLGTVNSGTSGPGSSVAGGSIQGFLNLNMMSRVHHRH